jgi:hypothetical protein
MNRMATDIFSSWKEIAQHLGKGVRTVQRWEQNLGLPVHRPAGASKGIVLAYRAEIESWAKTHHDPEQRNGNSKVSARDDQRRTELQHQLATRVAMLVKNAETLANRTAQAIAAAERSRARLSRADGKAPAAYAPGQTAPVTGVYRVVHAEHRQPHEVAALRGEIFPACKTCKTDAAFELIREAR